MAGSRRLRAVEEDEQTSPDEVPLPDRRTQIVAIVALLVGSAFLGLTLNVPDGSNWFFVCGFVLAAVWVTAYVVARTPHLRPRWSARELVIGAIAGAGMFVLFLVGRWLVDRLDILGSAVDDVLTTADASSKAPVLVLAIAGGFTEELFFRGTLMDAVRRRWAFVAGVVPYVITTAFGLNAALIVAALVVAVVCTTLRLRLDSLTAPIACHLVWTTLMITAFPR